MINVQIYETSDHLAPVDLRRSKETSFLSKMRDPIFAWWRQACWIWLHSSYHANRGIGSVESFLKREVDMSAWECSQISILTLERCDLSGETVWDSETYPPFATLAHQSSLDWETTSVFEWRPSFHVAFEINGIVFLFRDFHHWVICTFYGSPSVLSLGISERDDVWGNWYLHLANNYWTNSGFKWSFASKCSSSNLIGSWNHSLPSQK